MAIYHFYLGSGSTICTHTHFITRPSLSSVTLCTSLQWPPRWFRTSNTSLFTLNLYISPRVSFLGLLRLKTLDWHPTQPQHLSTPFIALRKTPAYLRIILVLGGVPVVPDYLTFSSCAICFMSMLLFMLP